MAYENMTKFYMGAPYVVTESVKVKHPTVRQIIKFGEEKYYTLLGILLTTPYKFMVQLDDMGINYEDVTDFEFFGVFVLPVLRDTDYSILFDGVSLSDFNPQVFGDEKKFVLYNALTGEIIDEEMYTDMIRYIMQINFIPPENKINAGNERTRKNLIKKEREKMKRQQNKKKQDVSSFLFDRISSLVWSSSHTFEQVMDLFIFQFNEGIRRVQKIKDYDQVMNAISYGNLSSKDVDPDVLDWYGEIKNKGKDVTFNVS